LLRNNAVFQQGLLSAAAPWRRSMRRAAAPQSGRATLRLPCSASRAVIAAIFPADGLASRRLAHPVERRAKVTDRGVADCRGPSKELLGLDRVAHAALLFASGIGRMSMSQAKVDVSEAQAKAEAIAKAKMVAPEVAARIGSTPRTKFRGDPDIFGRLVEDHDRHRALLAMIEETQGASADRRKLFDELVHELKAHAAAEEQALWSSVLRDPATTDFARHAIAEHKEIDDMLADLAARDMSSPGWLQRFAGLKDEYLHHIREEEQEQFVAAEGRLSERDLRHMRKVFEQRKTAEKAAAQVERKIKLKA